MQTGIHPSYRPVVFHDPASGDSFLTRSTLTSEQTTTWSDGQTYPLVRVDISAASHPFWTGQGQVTDAEGRVDKFYQRYGRPVGADSAPAAGPPYPCRPWHSPSESSGSPMRASPRSSTR